MWIVKNKFPFCDYKIYKNKPILHEDSMPDRYAQKFIYWHSTTEGGGLEISSEVVKFIVGEKGIEKLQNNEAIEVVMMPMEEEGKITLPTEPKELEIFKKGMYYILRESEE